MNFLSPPGTVYLYTSSAGRYLNFKLGFVCEIPKKIIRVHRDSSEALADDDDDDS